MSFRLVPRCILKATRPTPRVASFTSLVHILAPRLGLSIPLTQSFGVSRTRLIWRSVTTITSPSIFEISRSPVNSAPASRVILRSVESEDELPPLSSPVVSRWLLASASLVFAIVVVGGITRLTESGLSIVEWRPVSGSLPPLSEAEWETEFGKYKTSPEFKMMNANITLSEFKKIFFWEYAHRLLGRVIGVAFVVPLTYFALRRRSLTPGFQSVPLYGLLAVLIGAQGALGWYMVKSGLEETLLETPGAVARVSQYRLAAHLTLALLLYVGMLSSGLKVRMDWKWANKGIWSGLKASELMAEPWKESLQKGSRLRRFRAGAIGLGGLVFLTAFSGAFVAGLDAGLIYNEFPMMGENIAPPLSELLKPIYALRPDGSDMWRNIFENPTTVQFDHRILGTMTYIATSTLYLISRLSPAIRAALPPVAKHLVLTALGLANIQVLLGISTLIYLVPIPLAAAHQAGSVALLTAVVALIGSLRIPGRSARLWRSAKTTGASVRPAVQKSST